MMNDFSQTLKSLFVPSHQQKVSLSLFAYPLYSICIQYKVDLLTNNVYIDSIEDRIVIVCHGNLINVLLQVHSTISISNYCNGWKLIDEETLILHLSQHSLFIFRQLI